VTDPDLHRRAADIRAAHESAVAVAEYLRPDGKPPTKATRMKIANYLRAQAVMLRSEADGLREKPDEAGHLLRMAAQQEKRAVMFEEFADWVGAV
jgi:hypothetical protein